MRRMIVLTVGGGLLAAYLAYPYGILAAFLAYFLGGALFAGIGILSYVGPWVKESDNRSETECERHEPKAAAEGKSSVCCEFHNRADTVS